MPKNNFDDDDDDLLMALQSMEPCGNCGAEGAKIPCMSGCGEVFYCSRVRPPGAAARAPSFTPGLTSFLCRP